MRAAGQTIMREQLPKCVPSQQGQALPHLAAPAASLRGVIFFFLKKKNTFQKI